jgi:hypothetical protein
MCRHQLVRAGTALHPSGFMAHCWGSFLTPTYRAENKNIFSVISVCSVVKTDFLPDYQLYAVNNFSLSL